MEDPKLDEALAALATNEERLRCLLDKMRGAIEQSSAPHFKLFWEARERCVPLFKEGIHPAVRALLWQQYRDLSQEARMLSDLMGEKAAFAAEQIGLALDAIEAEMERPIEPAGLATFGSHTLKREGPALEGLQAELALLSQWTGRLMALRKELVATEMRMREKNALIKRLSALGDRAFPKRKERLEEISERFLGVVSRFVEGCCEEEGRWSAPFYVLKNEIKALQSFAKEITLTSAAFKEVRLALSTCWDRIRSAERGRQEEERERRAVAKEAAAAKRAAAEEEQRLRKEREEASRERSEALRGKIDALIEEGRHLTGDELAERRETLSKEIGEAELVGNERKGLLSALGKVADLMVDAEENAFLNTPDDHPDVASRLEMVLERKRNRRQGIKEALETLRKEAGGSGLDFDLALKIDGRIREEREKLSFIDTAISQIESRLNGLQR
ncbi:MAG: hypothetical protein AB7F31_02330 [Parachlamydiales bacterium]